MGAQEDSGDGAGEDAGGGDGGGADGGEGTVRAVVDEDGWFHTGDVGELDDQGRLRVLGRSKDVIVTANGLNVHPRDVESELAREGSVREAAVVGRPAEDGELVH